MSLFEMAERCFKENLRAPAHRRTNAIRLHSAELLSFGGLASTAATKAACTPAAARGRPGATATEPARALSPPEPGARHPREREFQSGRKRHVVPFLKGILIFGHQNSSLIPLTLGGDPRLFPYAKIEERPQALSAVRPRTYTLAMGGVVKRTFAENDAVGSISDGEAAETASARPANRPDAAPAPLRVPARAQGWNRGVRAAERGGGASAARLGGTKARRMLRNALASRVGRSPLYLSGCARRVPAIQAAAPCRCAGSSTCACTIRVHRAGDGTGPCLTGR